jgi:hypothetical protein
LVYGVHEVILEAATNEAYLLRESLDDLRAAIAAERKDAATLVSDVRRWRERLEAVRELLESVHQNGALEVVLHGIDDQARDEAVTFLLAGMDKADDLLASVACIDPEAWWGTELR